MAEKKAGPENPKRADADDDDWWSPLGGMQDLAQASISRLQDLIQPALRQVQELVSGQQANLQDVIARISKRVDQLQREVERQAKSGGALRARLTKQIEALRTAQRPASAPAAAKSTSRSRSAKPKGGRSATGRSPRPSQKVPKVRRPSRPQP